MQYANPFELVSTEFKRLGIPCLLVGGFAVNYHKVPRNTFDVDFLIAEADFDKASKALEDAGYILKEKKEAFARFDYKDFRLMDLDLLLVESETFLKLKKNGQEIRIAGQSFYVPSLDDLIALKLHAIKSNLKHREMKDFPDVINLITINKVDVRNKRFQDLCLKYGSQAIYAKILEQCD